MRMIHDLTGDPPLRRHQADFAALARIVVGQQLSIASAGAIWGRTEALAAPFSAKALFKLDDTRLKAAGLSRGKIVTLRHLASAVAGGQLDIDALSGMPDEDIHVALTAVHGIGPWTADIYIMFCLGRADAWAAGDLALKIAVADALKLDARPTSGELLEIAERWRPWRGVAARLLWAYYAAVKAVGSK